MKKIPNRQVHLDFHTSEMIDQVGSKFSAEEFADTLKNANVEAVTLFTRCHHGNLYYDSTKYPERIHPHLKVKDMYREQAKECRKKGIKVYLYTTICWDIRVAAEHPEWVAIDDYARISRRETGNIFEDPGFHVDLCINSPYREFCKEQIADALENCPVDGVLVDASFVVECCCPRCRKSMLEKHLNPADPQDRKKHAWQIYYDFVREMTDYLHEIDSDYDIFFNKGHVGAQDIPVRDCFDYVAVESQPANCGYMDFPVSARYLRTWGVPVVGMTGRFLTGWGDNNSYRNQAALEYESFSALSYGGLCNIGDQLPPSGQLDKDMYGVIGDVFRQVKEKEPWCEDVTALSEMAVFNPEEFYGGAPGTVNPHAEGVCRMLQELGYQYDLVDSESDYSQYRLLLLADNIPVDHKLECRLKEFMDQGGALIVMGEAGLKNSEETFAADCLGIRWNGESEYDADYIHAEGVLGKGLFDADYAMYLKSENVEIISEEASELLPLIAPLFNTTWEHYTGHLKAPSSEIRVGSAAVRKGNCIYFAHPLSMIYHVMGPKWVKQLLHNAIDVLMPDRLLEHTGPSTTIATVNEQTGKNRWIVHLMHYVPERRTEKYDIVEDIIPLYNIDLRVKTDRKPSAVRFVPQMKNLEFRYENRQVVVTIPKVEGHQMVEIQF